MSLSEGWGFFVGAMKRRARPEELFEVS